MNQTTKYILYAVAGLVAVGLAWYLFGAIGSTIAAMLGLGAAQKQLRSYVEAEAQAEAAKDRAQAEHAKATAEIEAEHTKEIKRIAEQHKAKEAETSAKVDAAETADDLDDVIDDAADDLDRAIGGSKGFVTTGLIQWLLLLGLLLAMSCRVGYASPDKPTAKHKQQVKRLLAQLNKATAAIQRIKATHKRDLAQLTEGHRQELSNWRAELKECQTKRRILAKPQPTWPRDVGFAIAGFGGAALLCGVGFGAAAVAGRVKIQ